MQQQAPAKKKKVRVPKVVNGVETMVEIEVDDEGGPQWGANDKHTLLNHRLTRVDAPVKVSGAALYTHDRRLPGMLYGRVVRSPHAHARVVRVDASEARRLPGVRAVLGATDEEMAEGSNRAAGEAAQKNRTEAGGAEGAGPGKLVLFAGQPVAAVAADTPETAEDAVRAIRVEYEVLPHAVRAEDALKEGAPKVLPDEPNVKERDKRGDEAKVAEALKQSDTVVEAEYRTPILHHSCLETHGNVIEYRGGGEATVYASTQGTFTIPGDAADALGLKEDRKSTRLNSSHDQISYAVFCLKKKNIEDDTHDPDNDMPKPHLTGLQPDPHPLTDSLPFAHLNHGADQRTPPPHARSVVRALRS